MQSTLTVVSERVVPEQETAIPQPQPAPAAPSSASSGNSLRAVSVLNEIRRVLNARAGALMAMTMAFVLTLIALFQGSGMALAVSISFDVLVFLPIAVIAYGRREE